MALQKVTYEPKKTVITAQNLNDIQDAILANEQAIEELRDKPTELVDVTVE